VVGLDVVVVHGGRVELVVGPVGLVVGGDGTVVGKTGVGGGVPGNKVVGGRVPGKKLVVVEPPGTVLPGTVLPGNMVVLVGQGPTPPPGRGQSKWLVVVVMAGAAVVVGPDVVHPSLWRRDTRACRADPRSPTLFRAAWSWRQALDWAPVAWAALTEDGSIQPMTMARATTTPRQGNRSFRTPSAPAAELSLPRSFMPSPPASPRSTARP
jgi:hypothetical protein